MSTITQENFVIHQLQFNSKHWDAVPDLDDRKRLFEELIFSGVMVGWKVGSDYRVLGTYVDHRLNQIRLSNGSIIKWSRKDQTYVYKSGPFDRDGCDVTVNAVEKYPQEF